MAVKDVESKAYLEFESAKSPNYTPGWPYFSRLVEWVVLLPCKYMSFL